MVCDCLTALKLLQHAEHLLRARVVRHGVELRPAGATAARGAGVWLRHRPQLVRHPLLHCNTDTRVYQDSEAVQDVPVIGDNLHIHVLDNYNVT